MPYVEHWVHAQRQGQLHRRKTCSAANGRSTRCRSFWTITCHRDLARRQPSRRLGRGASTASRTARLYRAVIFTRRTAGRGGIVRARRRVAGSRARIADRRHGMNAAPPSMHGGDPARRSACFEGRWHRAGIVPDLVVGASVGAINGACYRRSPDAAGIDASKTSGCLRRAGRVPVVVAGYRAAPARATNMPGGIRSSTCARWSNPIAVRVLLEAAEIQYRVVARCAGRHRSKLLSSGDAATAASQTRRIRCSPVVVQGAR